MDRYGQLSQHHISTGYWNGDSRYQHLLSPNPFVLPEIWKPQLREIGKVVAGFQKGMPSIFTTLSAGKTNLHQNLLHLFKDGTYGMPLLQLEQKIPLIKVDIMVSAEDDLRIAEIDAYNPRALAYMELLRDLYGLPASSAANYIAHEVHRRGKEKLLWVYANHERFYLPGLEQYSRIMKRDFNIDVLCVNATELQQDHIKGSVILITPWGMRQPEEIPNRDLLLDLYSRKPEKFIYPLVPWLGAKGLLGLVSNPTQNPEIEQLIKEFPKKDLFDRYVPATTVLSQKLPCSTEWAQQQKELVLKLSVSSGMKGVWFNGEAKSQLVSMGKNKKPISIAQQYVHQKRLILETNQGEKECFARLIAYVNQFGVVTEVLFTGSPTHAVHGGTDSILLPCV